MRNQKLIVVVALALVLTLVAGTSLAACKINSKSVSANARYQENEDGERKGYAVVRCSLSSDTEGHSMAVTVEMQHKGVRQGVGTGTSSARYSQWFNNGEGTITAIGSGWCQTCGTVCLQFTASDAVWEEY